MVTYGGGVETTPRTVSAPRAQENPWGKVPVDKNGHITIYCVIERGYQILQVVSPFMVLAIRQPCCPNNLFPFSGFMGVEFYTDFLGVSHSASTQSQLMKSGPFCLYYVFELLATFWFCFSTQLQRKTRVEQP